VDVSTETLTPTRVRLTVTVPFAELTPNVEAAYKKVAAQIRVPGFRPGRIPRQLVDQRVGRGAVLEEALNEALPRLYSAAVEQSATEVISRPEVDVTGFGDGEPLVFTADVDVRPEVELGEYSGLAVTVDDADVTDADADAQLDELRRGRGTLADADRPAADGDLLTLDLTTTVDGAPVPGAAASGMTYGLGEGGLVPGLDDALRGVTAGETRGFATELTAGERAGETAQVEVRVSAVQERRLPEFDDAFAATVGPYGGVAELRQAVRENLVRVKLLQQGLQARDRTLDALLEHATLPLPETVVAAEIQARREQLEAQLQQYGMTVPAYLEGLGRDAGEHESVERAEAEKAVKTQLVLDAVATKEELGVTEAELMEQIVRRAERAGVRPDVYASQVVQSGSLQAVMAEVVRGKALALVLEQAVVTDAAGRPVDLEALRDDAPAVDVVDDVDAPGEVEVEGVKGVDSAAADAGGGVLLGPDGRPIRS